jgi:hypothetical protein
VIRLEGGGALVGFDDLLAQLGERHEIGVEPLAIVGNGLFVLGAALIEPGALVATRRDPGVELTRLLLEPADLERQRRRALDERGMAGLGGGGVAARRPEGLAAGAEDVHGGRQAGFDDLALGGETGDRRA